MLRTLLLLLGLAFYSCNSNEHTLKVNIENTYNSSNFGEVIKIQAKMLVDSIIGQPDRLAISQSNVIVYDKKKNPAFTLYDLIGGEKLEEFGERGPGKNELLRIFNFQYLKDSLLFMGYDPQLKKAIIYDLKNNSDKKVLREYPLAKIKVKTTHRLSFSQDLDKAFIINGENSNWRVAKVNPVSNEVEETFGNLPISFSKDIPEIIKAGLFECSILMHPSKNMMALINFNIDLVECYDLDKEELLWQSKGPDDWSLHFKIESSDGYPSTANLGYRAFYSGNTTEKHIYALYQKSQPTNIKGNVGATTVLVYDWKGKPVKQYELDKPMRFIAINEELNRMVGVSKESDKLFYFNL